MSLPPRGIHRGCSRRPVIHRRWSRGSKSLLAALRVCGRGRDCQGLNCFRAPCLVLQDHTTRRASRQMHPRTQIIRTSTSNHQTIKPTNQQTNVCTCVATYTYAQACVCGSIVYTRRSTGMVMPACVRCCCVWACLWGIGLRAVLCCVNSYRCAQLSQASMCMDACPCAMC